MPLIVGSPAPDFNLLDENHASHRLSDYRGRDVVLYFYPEDDTPGCTKEACAFRDDYSTYVGSNVVILGVSPDSPESHLKFKEKYQLPFSLLADDGHLVCEAYGVWGEKTLFGKTYMGVLRTTFLIDKQGKIKTIFKNIKPAGHSVEVLAAFQ